jgi:hypothetical protein
MRKSVVVEMTEQGLTPSDIEPGRPARADLIRAGWTAAEIDAAAWDDVTGAWIGGNSHAA